MNSPKAAPPVNQDQPGLDDGLSTAELYDAAGVNSPNAAPPLNQDQPGLDDGLSTAELCYVTGVNSPNAPPVNQYKPGLDDPQSGLELYVLSGVNSPNAAPLVNQDQPGLNEPLSSAELCDVTGVNSPNAAPPVNQYQHGLDDRQSSLELYGLSGVSSPNTALPVNQDQPGLDELLSSAELGDLAGVNSHNAAPPVNQYQPGLNEPLSSAELCDAAGVNNSNAAPPVNQDQPGLDDRQSSGELYGLSGANSPNTALPVNQDQAGLDDDPLSGELYGLSGANNRNTAPPVNQDQPGLDELLSSGELGDLSGVNSPNAAPHVNQDQPAMDESMEIHDDSLLDPDYVPGSESSDDEGEKDGVSIPLIEHRGLSNNVEIQDDDPGTASDLSDEIPVQNRREISVMKGNGKGCRGKKHACLFCSKLYENMSRHLAQVHKHTPEVSKVLLLELKSTERRKAWEELVNKGDYHHNYEVLERGHGTVIPKYRPRVQSSEDHGHYVPCTFCLGMFCKVELWKHQKTCPAAPKSDDAKDSALRKGKLLLPCKMPRTKLYQDIIVHMRDDQIRNIVQGDDIILEYGDRMLEFCSQEVHAFNYISTKLRELGKFVKEMRALDPSVKNLSNALGPSSWNTVLKAVRETAGYDQDSQSFKIPSLAIKLGHALKKCAEIKESRALVQQDDSAQQEAGAFIRLYNNEWNDRISRVARQTLDTKQYNKPKLLPLMEDVEKLHRYLEKEAKDLCERCKVDPNGHYQMLSQVLLAQIITFNRKRCGEVQRMKCEEVETALRSQEQNLPDDEIMTALTKFEIELCKSHVRVEIQGKRGRRVPVLLTSSMVDGLNVLLDSRQAVGIIGSKYLFARPGKTIHPYRGDKVLRDCAEAAGVTEPDRLTSTRLRKHLATMSQVLNLKEYHTDMLARFMGHDLVIHRKYYRLPHNILEMAKISKILHAINEGTVAQFKGKNLDEITVEAQGRILHQPSSKM